MIIHISYRPLTAPPSLQIADQIADLAAAAHNPASQQAAVQDPRQFSDEQEAYYTLQNVCNPFVSNYSDTLSLDGKRLKLRRGLNMYTWKTCFVGASVKELREFNL